MPSHSELEHEWVQRIAAAEDPERERSDTEKRIEAITAARVAAVTDTEMLNFLEKNRAEGLHPCYHEEREQATTPEVRYWKRSVFDGWCVGSRDPWPTVREAIGAAMREHSATPASPDHIPQATVSPSGDPK